MLLKNKKGVVGSESSLRIHKENEREEYTSKQKRSQPIESSRERIYRACSIESRFHSPVRRAITFRVDRQKVEADK